MNDERLLPEFDAPAELSAVAPIDCDEVRDLIPALALGAIETGSRHLVRLHCASCALCANELADLERVALLLPFSAPLVAPPSTVKTSLMARISEPQVISPAFSFLESPVIDGPADKRRSTAVNAGRSNDLLDRTLSFMSGQGVKLAAAPLALALVFVSLYGFGVFDSSDNAAAPAATIEAASSDLSDAVSSAPDFEVSFLSAGTSGASVTRPSSVNASSSTSSFMARSSRSGTQTALLSSVVPRFAECEIAQGEGGKWSVAVSGVSLPYSATPSDVFLVSQTGEKVLVGDVKLDQFGNGKIIFEIDRPLSDFVTLQIRSAAEAGETAADYQHVSFQLSLADRLSQGLGRSD